MRLLAFVLALLLAPACSAAPPPVTVVVYGDSISAGSGEDLGDPALWPNKLERLLEEQGRDATVTNRSINGNGLVWRTRCFGRPVIERLTADLPTIRKDAILVIMAGANDLIQPSLPKGFSPCFDPADLPASHIIAQMEALRVSAGGRRVLIATIGPFSASEFHSPAAETKRAMINQWIRGRWRKHDVIDLDRVLASASDPTKLAAELDSGDGLHPNGQGAEVIAMAVAERVI